MEDWFMKMASKPRIVPPSPELEKKIIKTKKMFSAKEALPSTTTVDVLDLRSFQLITSRPMRTRSHTLISREAKLAPVVGTRKALVLLVDFSNNTATQSKGHFADMLFSSGGATKSLRDFYWEASYNKLTVTGDVSGEGGPTEGWYRAPQAYTYYTNGEYGFGTYPKNAQKLVEDAVDLAAPHVNFANYDNDGDGVVDALFIVHAGPGAETTGNVDHIWSHKWGINPKTVDGVKVSSYSMEPEDGRIGVFCHELGHVFGLPDLYDYDYDSAGVGRWCLMAGGSWNGGGNSPAHPTSWCKVKLGWVNPVTIFNAQQAVTIKPYATNAQVYKLPVGDINSKEYFLLSNRNKTGFDTDLPGEGLSILHVDDNQSNNNDQDHYLVDVEQADGKFELNKNINSGNAPDMFPSTSSEFTATSTPSSKAYGGSDSKVSVTGIQRSGDDIKANINVGGAAVKAWYYNKKVLSTFAHHTTQWAWAYIDTLGWRRIKDGSADGVTNIFNACCEAVANNKLVHVYVDNEFLYTMYLI